MTNISAVSAAVVHTSQVQTVTQSVSTREPEPIHTPIVDEPRVEFGTRDGYTLEQRPTYGNHINMTV